MYLFIFHLIMEFRWLRNIVKRVSFICFSFLVLNFLNNCLWNYNKRIFVSSATRSACAKILGSLATHTPVLKSSRLSPLSWFLHLEQAAVIIIFIEIITLIWLFGLDICYQLSLSIFFAIRLISNTKQQEQQKNLPTLRTDSPQIEGL